MEGTRSGLWSQSKLGSSLSIDCKKDVELLGQQATPHEASAEVQGPRRRVMRVESEETQDYVRETLAISQEEADEIGFVRSALSEP